uniref:Family with sequence similarity 131 member A n=1 Tax=Callorhinchus milii TaxID=7868 RepID=A0A4W3HXU4_CALMI
MILILALSRLKVNVEDTVEMLPKSRRGLTIQEIAALARSSLHGFSQVVKDHVTKPTAMAQGRVAHLIEWKGWCKPMESPMTLEIDFSSYSDLSECEQEARFAAGVAEQFAIAEAKLKAWSSVDGDDSNDDSYDEDFTVSSETTESDSSQTVSPETLCSSLCSLEDHPLLRLELASPGELTAKLFGRVAVTPVGVETVADAHGDGALVTLSQLICQDSSYSVSYAESCFTPDEDEMMCCQDYKTLGKEPDGFGGHRKASDVVSSGVASLEEGAEEEEEDKEETGHQ